MKQPDNPPRAELNVASALDDLDSERLADFMAALDKINGLAERSPGYVWRLTDEGGDATGSEVADDVTLEGSPTFDAMTERGKVVIGVKEDQPNLGYLDVTTGERTGFDIDIARWIAASLGFDEDKIEFEPIASANRGWPIERAY